MISLNKSLTHFIRNKARDVDSESHNTNTCKVKIPKLDCTAENLHDVMNSEPARPSEKVYCMRRSRTFCQTMITLLFFRLFS